LCQSEFEQTPAVWPKDIQKDVLVKENRPGASQRRAAILKERWTFKPRLNIYSLSAPPARENKSGPPP
jgi:hypothetical protein